MNEIQPLKTPQLFEPVTMAPVPSPEPPQPTLRRLFFGDDGLRAGWSVLLFFLIVGLLAYLNNLAVKHFHIFPPHPKRVPGGPVHEERFRYAFIGESMGLALFVISAYLMSLIEKRPFRRYGFTSERCVWDVAAGLAWGLIALSGLVGVLFLTHHVAFDATLLHGTGALTFGVKWAVFFFLVGLAEEFQTRGYIQYTVSRGVAGIARAINPAFRHSHAIGFWVSAFLFSALLFMAGHLANPGETLPGILAVGLAGITFAFSLYRTGSLWWAIGFHTAWDWAQSFLYGVPDSGTMVQGHLFATHPLGAPLISGAATGPEGSIFVLPTLLLVCLVIHLTLPRRSYFLTPDQSPLPLEPRVETPAASPSALGNV